MTFYPPAASRDPILEFINTDPAVVAYGNAMRSQWFGAGLRYEGLRMRKAMMSDAMSVQMIAEARATLSFTPRDDMPPQLVPDPDPAHLKPAKAPQMRKLIESAFKELFAPQKKKLPGGSTGYTGVVDGSEITVWTDYAGMGMQLIYGVSIPDDTKQVFVSRLAYENLWGAGRGWDYITEDNAESSMGLLCNLVTRLTQLRNAAAGVIGAAPGSAKLNTRRTTRLAVRLSAGAKSSQCGERARLGTHRAFEFQPPR